MNQWSDSSEHSVLCSYYMSLVSEVQQVLWHAGVSRFNPSASPVKGSKLEELVKDHSLMKAWRATDSLNWQYIDVYGPMAWFFSRNPPLVCLWALPLPMLITLRALLAGPFSFSMLALVDCLPVTDILGKPCSRCPAPPPPRFSTTSCWGAMDGDWSGGRNGDETFSALRLEL